ncbi:MAG: hypothetical protein OXB84_07690 [Halobacteriovoraceae bacterium]|nr:hypothetical protein [Halobacteriovoraceae bacterium]
MKFHPVSFSLILLLAGCRSDPYPTEGDLRFTPQKAKREPRPSAAYKIKHAVEFTEGVPGIIPIEVQIPGNDPVIELKNPPYAALEENRMYVDQSDPNDIKIRWTPDFFAADDPRRPGLEKRYYSVIVHIYSKSNPEIFSEDEIYFSVLNKKGEFKITGNDFLVIKEGQSLHEVYTIINEDFPNYQHELDFTSTIRKEFFDMVKYFSIQTDPRDKSKHYLVSTSSIPFDFVQIKNVIAGQIEEEANSLDLSQSTQDLAEELVLSYKCAEKKDKYFDGCKIKTQILLEARDRSHTPAYHRIHLEIHDTRTDPFISMPTAVSKGSNVNFTITASDNNREYNPRIHLRKPQGPVYGKLRCYNLDSEGNREDNPERVYDNENSCSYLLSPSPKPNESDISTDGSFTRRIEVSWTNIPEGQFDENAILQELVFEVCTIGKTKNSFDHCLAKSVSFNNVYIPRNGPVFLLEEIGTIYENINRKVYISLPIREPDDETQKSHLTNIDAVVTPIRRSSPQNFSSNDEPKKIPVVWNKDKETIEFLSPAYTGLSTVELTVTAESIYKIESSITFSIDIETVSDRLFISTNDLMTEDPEVSNARLDEMAKIVKKVIIDTPHLDKLPPGIRQSLEKFGIKYFKDIIDRENISERRFFLAQSAGSLKRINGNLFLSDLENDESSPTMVSYDASSNTWPASKCQELFFIDKKPADPGAQMLQMITSIPVAVRCKKTERITLPDNKVATTDKTFVIFGFDYHKLKSDSKDEDPTGYESDEKTIENWRMTQTHYSY